MKGFPQVTAEGGAIRFERGGDLQIRAARLRLTLPDAAQAAPEPGVAEFGIDGERLFKGRECFRRLVPRRQQEAAQGHCPGIAWSELQAFLHGLARGGSATESKLQFRHARPAEGEVGRDAHGLARGGERFVEFGARLQVIGFGEQCGGKSRRLRPGVFLVFHRRNLSAQGVG